MAHTHTRFGRLRCNELLLLNIEVRDDSFQTQLDVYAGLTQDMDLPGAWFEADFYKAAASHPNMAHTHLNTAR
eukprot:2940292-Prymnesium_polylepis.1